VKQRLDLKVSDLGPVPLKNIAEPMRAYSLDVEGPMRLATSQSGEAMGGLAHPLQA
jgi:class 3 adenylate cyclase